MKKCKYCRERVTGNTHYCYVEDRYVTDPMDFFISAAIGAATDSAILGGLLGGDFLGGIVGDLLDGDLMD